MVLAAGLGTRLRPLTEVRAKPALPVAGEPIIRRILRRLVAHGIVNVTVNLHHLPETVTAVVGDGGDLGARVRYSWEQPTILGSAGGPRQALDILGVETFFLINGDTLTDLDMRALAESHTRSGARVTLALVPNVDPLRYGGVLLSEDGGVLGFVPRGPAAAGSLHFIGVQLVHGSVFSGLPPARAAERPLLGHRHGCRLLADLVVMDDGDQPCRVGVAYRQLGDHQSFYRMERGRDWRAIRARRMYRD
jgi:NDP-sugar pyrophosphorylase family protein